MNINLVVKLNYLVFFCAVMNFLTSIDALIEETIAHAYSVIIPRPIGALIHLLWPFGFTVFVYFVTGVAIVLNVDALSQVGSPADMVRNRMAAANKAATAPVRLYYTEEEAQLRGTGGQQRQFQPQPWDNRKSSHIADYLRSSTPLLYPRTDAARITYFFPNEEACQTEPPRAYKSFVVIPKEESALGVSKGPKVSQEKGDGEERSISRSNFHTS